ncbi:hypothetical protein P167DRAFT_559945 [Morchella conica CCBAS932]|uniref:Uncharacterized protein n=1 Tax=Morchella conica CCBAS932 TaxID=1392247 RepID=A0A3N4KKQ6_9PEZI|nr:hypothetical protein P167DRAFT_559945 [Morchella conica CCBAS932]
MKRKLAEVTGFDGHLQPPPSPRHGKIPPLMSASRPKSFRANASIALIGLRGVGKSTIGVIVSSTLRRRLIDADMHFFQDTGMAAAQYATAHGWPAYRAKEADILADILRDHDTGAVIVCSSGCVEKPGSRALLREWMERHPVVHIVRHEKETLRRLAARREPMYTVCSNFEFYNMWDKQLQATSGKSSPSSPTLKKVEQDFLRLLNFAFQQEMAPLIVWDRNSPHPASAAASTALEDRLYAYALVLPPSASFGPIDGGRIDIDELGATVEAFDLRIDHLLHSGMPVGDNPATLRFVSEQFAHVRRQSHLPIIYHVGTANEDGSYPAQPTDARGEDDYFNLLHHGLRLGAEYLVVELQFSDQRIRELVASRGATKIIGSYHENSGAVGWGSPERMKMYDRAAQLGCNIARLTQRATSQGDNFAAISFSWEVKRRRDAAAGAAATAQRQPSSSSLPPLIAFNTGKLGRMSRFMNRVLSPVTHPRLVEYQKEQQMTVDEEDAITPREALIAIHACSVLPRRQFCIFGSAITHSLSPAMHNAAYAEYGLPHNYRIQQAASINELLHIVQDPNFGGASVTLPFKLEIIPLLHSISDHARAIGAVNTIIPIDTDHRGGGRAHPGLHGDNTDWIGIRTCTLRYLTPVNAITARTSALVVGAGGMARAAVYALQKLGVENIFIYGRSVNRAADLAQYFNCRSRSSSLAVPSTTDSPEAASNASSPTNAANRSTVRVLPSLEHRWPEDFWLPSIVVSCIPAHSIQGAPPANFTLPEAWLASPTGGVCVELAYKPRVTPLLRQVRALAHRGWIGVDGLEVLPEQGYAQFEMFLGRQAPRRVMREAVEAAYEEARRASAESAASRWPGWFEKWDDGHGALQRSSRD